MTERSESERAELEAIADQIDVFIKYGTSAVFEQDDARKIASALRSLAAPGQKPPQDAGWDKKSTRDIRWLVSSARAFLRHFNPCNLAEDKSQQWQSLSHQCDVVERALRHNAPPDSGAGKSVTDLRIYCGDNPLKWAEEFCQIKQKQGWSVADIDENLMLGWFANAIEQSTALRRTAPPDSGAGKSEPIIGGTGFCGHSVMAAICEKCSPAATKSADAGVRGNLHDQIVRMLWEKQFEGSPWQGKFHLIRRDSLEGDYGVFADKLIAAIKPAPVAANASAEAAIRKIRHIVTTNRTHSALDEVVAVCDALIECDANASAELQNDLAEMLRALGMSDAAQPKSPHEVFQSAIAEMKRQIANASAEARLREALEKTSRALEEIKAIVWGECPSLLNEDSGGNARLDMDIDDALEAAQKALSAHPHASDWKEEESRCTCGAGHGSLEGHTDWCAWVDASDCDKHDIGPVQHWAVNIHVNGVQVLNIESECLSGIPNIDDYADVVRNCANHLLSFIGDEIAESASDCDKQGEAPPADAVARARMEANSQLGTLDNALQQRVERRMKEG